MPMKTLCSDEPLDPEAREVWRKKRVVIVEEHASIRQMLAMTLRLESNIEIVGEAGTGLQAMDVCRRTQPDGVILDLLLPELCGIEVLHRLRHEWPKLRVLVYTGARHQPTLLSALRGKPHGFVQKSDSLETLREAVRVVMGGGTYLTPFIKGLVRGRMMDELHEVTAREREVLQMVAEGRSSKEVATRLGIAMKTVEHHRAHVMEKLGLHDVASLTRFAIHTGLVAA